MESYINVDPNMVVRSKIENVDVNWYDVRQAPFSIHGLYEPLTEPYFRRVPAEVADATGEGVSLLSQETTGGRVRFSTDSAYVAIRAKLRVVGRSPHLTLLSSSTVAPLRRASYMTNCRWEVGWRRSFSSSSSQHRSWIL